MLVDHHLLAKLRVAMNRGVTGQVVMRDVVVAEAMMGKMVMKAGV
jgi:hypothetical protein